MTVCDVDIVRLLGSLRAGDWEVASLAAERLPEDGREGMSRERRVSLPASRAMPALARRRRRCPLIAAGQPQDDERHAVAQGIERRGVAAVGDHRR